MSLIDHATNRTFDQPVCFMNMLFESNMNPVGSQIDINLKQMTTTDPNLECYFWCSFDGLVPIRPDIETIGLSLLKKENQCTISSRHRTLFFGHFSCEFVFNADWKMDLHTRKMSMGNGFGSAYD